MTEPKLKRLAPRAKCPCNSGKQYGKCCYSKAFMWMQDEKKRVFKRVPDHPMLSEALTDMRRDFLRQFGREPSDGDLPWFGKHSINWMKEKVTQAMVEADFDPAFIYAYRKTGLLVFRENLHLIPDKDLREWNAAIRNFKKRQRKLLTREDRLNHRILNQMVLVSDICDRAVVFLRCIVRDHGIARNIGAKRQVHVFHDYMFFCLTKALKSLSAIQLLVPEGFGKDGLTLVRTVYENYLNMTFLLANPEKINDLVVAKVRLSAGLCEVLKTQTGKKVIQEKKSGRQFERLGPIHLARGSRYREDIRIHNVLYNFLCEHAHPNIMSMEAFLNENRFEESNTQMVNQTTIYSGLYSLLILDLSLRFRFLNDQFRKDLLRFLQESKPHMIKIFRLIKVSGKWIDGREQIISRMGHIGLANDTSIQR